jgi:hypothetical protein
MQYRVWVREEDMLYVRANAGPTYIVLSEMFQKGYKVAGSYPRRPQGPDNSAGHTKATDQGLQPPRPLKEPGGHGDHRLPIEGCTSP